MVSAWVWLGIIIVLTIIEAITIDLVTIWFIASALISLIISFFIDSYFIQFLVFVVLGTILLLTTRKSLQKLFGKVDSKTNLDRVIGMEAIVTEEIMKNKVGEVKVDGKRWSAISDKKISVGSTVKVLSINGVKLKVEEVDE